MAIVWCQRVKSLPLIVARFCVYVIDITTNACSAAIMMVVQPDEENRFDQRWVEYTVMRKFEGVRVVRRSLSEIHEQASLNTDSKLMM